MWILYRIIGSSSTLKVLLRLRPAQAYGIKIKGPKEDTVVFRVAPFSKKDVTNTRLRPDLILTRNDHKVAIDQQYRNEEEIHLHDQQILHIGKSLSPYKVAWVPLTIFHHKGSNRQVHEELIEQGTQLGFHVIKNIYGQFDKPTHYCISDNPKLYDPSTYTYFSLALNNVYFVRPQWANELCETEDANFDIKAFNDKIQPILEQDFRNMGQTAVFGPDERRKRLFKNMEFWFFNQQQFNDNEKLIKLAGGKSILTTFEQAMHMVIGEKTLLIAPPDADNLPGWIPVFDKFCTVMEVNRALQAQEIRYAILFCSTNFMCNPASSPDDYLHPGSDLYNSIQSTTYSPSNTVKMESLDPTMPANYSYDNLDFQHSQHLEHDDDDFVEIKSEQVESTQVTSARMEEVDERQQLQEEHVQCRRLIKEEVQEDEEMSTSHEPVASKSSTLQPTEHQGHGSQTISSSPNAYPIAEEEEEGEAEEPVSAVSPAMSTFSAREAEREEVDSVTADSPIMSMDLMDMDAFLGDMFESLNAQKQKERERKIQQQEKEQEAKRKQEEDKQEELKRQQEAARNKVIQEQALLERDKYDKELQQRIQTERARPRQEDVVMEPLEDDEEEEEEEEEEETNEGTQEEHADEANPAPAPVPAPAPAPTTIENDHTNDPTIVRISEPDPNSGRYSRIIYKDLEVNPQPPKPATGTINYKKFKKVKQFENYSNFESSQGSGPPPSSQNNRRRGRDIFFDTDPGIAIPEDPDIVIRVNRSRYR